jgi:hypothetical protein
VNWSDSSGHAAVLGSPRASATAEDRNRAEMRGAGGPLRPKTRRAAFRFREAQAGREEEKWGGVGGGSPGSAAVALTRRNARPCSWPRIWWTPSRSEAWKWLKPRTSFLTSTAVPRIRPSFHASLFFPVSRSKNPCSSILASPDSLGDSKGSGLAVGQTVTGGALCSLACRRDVPASWGTVVAFEPRSAPAFIGGCVASGSARL